MKYEAIPLFSALLFSILAAPSPRDVGYRDRAVPHINSSNPASIPKVKEIKDPLLTKISGEPSGPFSNNESRKQERAKCVYEKIALLHDHFNGTKNVLILNAKARYTFSNKTAFTEVGKFPCDTDPYHNRPFPYKAYAVEPAPGQTVSVTRKGDGGYVNWAYKHRNGIEPPSRKENDPTITFI